MPVNQHLLTLLTGRSVVEHLAGKMRVDRGNLRALASVYCLCGLGRKSDVRGVATLQGLATTEQVRREVYALRESGHLQAKPGTVGRHQYTLTPAGLRLVGLLEREERDARRRAQSVVVSRKKRAYVKSGEFVGKAAVQAERSRARTKE